MKKAIILLSLVLFGCDYTTVNEYTECDSGECDAGSECTYNVCCFYYPFGETANECGIVEGLDNEEECQQLAEESYAENPSPDGAIHSAVIPLPECWMYDPEWCNP